MPNNNFQRILLNILGQAATTTLTTLSYLSSHLDLDKEEELEFFNEVTTYFNTVKSASDTFNKYLNKQTSVTEDL